VSPMPYEADPEDARSPYDGLPGWELVAEGLRDLEAGRRSVPALLVASASVRLTELGLPVRRTAGFDAPAALFELVAADVGDRAAHARYNALRRRLASFLRAASRARAR
jgi:hypothetical protein